MSDTSAGVNPEDGYADPDLVTPFDAETLPADTLPAETLPADTLPADTDDPSARARRQRRLAQARVSMRQATLRARQSAMFPSRRSVEPSDDSVDVPASTLVDRAQAYRVHIASAVAAVVALLVVVMKRRASADDGQDDVLDLGEWHLLAEPVDE